MGGLIAKYCPTRFGPADDNAPGRKLAKFCLHGDEQLGQDAHEALKSSNQMSLITDDFVSGMADGKMIDGNIMMTSLNGLFDKAEGDAQRCPVMIARYLHDHKDTKRKFGNDSMYSVQKLGVAQDTPDQVMTDCWNELKQLDFQGVEKNSDGTEAKEGMQSATSSTGRAVGGMMNRFRGNKGGAAKGSTDWTSSTSASAAALEIEGDGVTKQSSSKINEEQLIARKTLSSSSDEEKSSSTERTQMNKKKLPGDKKVNADYEQKQPATSSGGPSTSSKHGPPVVAADVEKQKQLQSSSALEIVGIPTPAASPEEKKPGGGKKKMLRREEKNKKSEEEIKVPEEHVKMVPSEVEGKSVSSSFHNFFSRPTAIAQKSFDQLVPSVNAINVFAHEHKFEVFSIAGIFLFFVLKRVLCGSCFKKLSSNNNFSGGEDQQKWHLINVVRGGFLPLPAYGALNSSSSSSSFGADEFEEDLSSMVDEDDLDLENQQFYSSSGCSTASSTRSGGHGAPRGTNYYNSSSSSAFISDKNNTSPNSSSRPSSAVIRGTTIGVGKLSRAGEKDLFLVAGGLSGTSDAYNLQEQRQDHAAVATSSLDRWISDEDSISSLDYQFYDKETVCYYADKATGRMDKNASTV
ncbi:unnamed protein product [Amoebophrya sp. A120]|nr:unnamed protein product [Amoebophrya sp. A120]|eukprot:GSA120T00013807001.1